MHPRKKSSVVSKRYYDCKHTHNPKVANKRLAHCQIRRRTRKKRNNSIIPENEYLFLVASMRKKKIEAENFDLNAKTKQQEKYQCRHTDIVKPSSRKSE